MEWSLLIGMALLAKVIYDLIEYARKKQWHEVIPIAIILVVGIVIAIAVNLSELFWNDINIYSTIILGLILGGMASFAYDIFNRRVQHFQPGENNGNENRGNLCD